MEIEKQQLELLIRLQPFFKKMMGENPEGFQFYNPVFGKIFPLNRISDSWYHSDYPYRIGCRCSKEEGIVIPVPLDLTCSKRCLWGMIENHLDLLNNKTNIFEADNPVTAMLLALCEQTGV